MNYFLSTGNYVNFCFIFYMRFLEENMKNIMKFTFVFFLFPFLVSGCIIVYPVTQSTPSTSPSPLSFCASFYVVSNCQECTGSILINGKNTGIYLASWGGTFVNDSSIKCGEIVLVNLMNKYGVISHTEARTATYPQTIIQFDWFIGNVRY